MIICNRCASELVPIPTVCWMHKLTNGKLRMYPYIAPTELCNGTPIYIPDYAYQPLSIDEAIARKE